jgi:bacillithiol biosynthesis deacetylase BshB1
MTDTSHLIQGTLQPVDILAIGPHPDDIEIGCAGTLLKFRQRGDLVGLLDLTGGELGTKGDGPTRLAESREAARRLGATFRCNLAIPDGTVHDVDHWRVELVRLIRIAKPTWVFCNLEETRHPDHAGGAQLVKAAFFLARLPRYLSEIPAHSPEGLFFYLIHEQPTPSFLVDISDIFEQKFDVMQAFTSQFMGNDLPDGYRHTGLSDYLQNVRSLGEAWGVQAGTAAAEAFVCHRPLVLGGTTLPLLTTRD